MKLKLNDDQMSDNFFEGTRILGIASTLKNYQLCFHIEKELFIDFRTSADLQIPLEKNTNHENQMVPFENHKSYENLIIPIENHENH